MKSIDEIREEMIETVTCSKSDIFQIGEQCRQDYENMINELDNIKQMMVETHRRRRATRKTSP